MATKKADMDFDAGSLAAKLAVPFPATAVKHRLQQVIDSAGKKIEPQRGGVRYPGAAKGKFFAYIDARDVQQRLDDVVGPGAWTFDWSVIEGIDARDAVKGTLGIMVDGGWISKSDVGYRNNPERDVKDEREPLKATVSDAFKRAAVHWGIGRFLYDLELSYVPCDTRGKPTPQGQAMLNKFLEKVANARTVLHPEEEPELEIDPKTNAVTEVAPEPLDKQDEPLGGEAPGGVPLDSYGSTSAPSPAEEQAEWLAGLGLEAGSPKAVQVKAYITDHRKKKNELIRPEVRVVCERIAAGKSAYDLEAQELIDLEDEIPF